MSRVRTPARLRAALGREDGWAMVTAMAVMAVTALLGFSVLSFVDGQSRLTGMERKQESAFNLAEAALQAQVLRLGSAWPDRAGGAYSSPCTQVSTSTSCPDSGEMLRSFTGADYQGAAWRVTVHDDGGGLATYFDPGAAASQPGWDANANDRVWVRAEATARGRRRAIATQVRPNREPLPFPRNVVTAGHFATQTNARKTLVDTQGGEAQPSAVAVRCTAPPRSGCLDYDPARGQVSPNTYELGVASSALSSDMVEELREQARRASTLHPGCPPSASGALVFVASGNCGYGGSGSANSAASPGIFIVERGSFALSGSARFHGLVYVLNAQSSSATLVTVSGNAQLVGAIAVDGAGGASVGNSGRNLIFDDAVLDRLATTRQADVVRSTWREVPAR